MNTEYKLDHYYDDMCPRCYPLYGCKGSLCEKHAVRSTPRAEEQRNVVRRTPQQDKHDKPITDPIP